MAKSTQRSLCGPRPAASSRFSFDPPLVLRSCADEFSNGLRDWCRAAATEVLEELWLEDVERLCGERWKPRSRAKVARAGWCATDIVLGAERISVRRPRVRSAQGREVELPSFRAAADEDFLSRPVIEDVCAAVATGSFPEQRYTRGSILTAFVDQLVGRLGALHAAPKGVFDPGLLIHGVTFPDQSFLGALGIDSRGARRLLGLASGRLDDSDRVEALVSDVVARHQRRVPPSICFVGESEVVHQAVRKVFGAAVILRRCPAEKRRRTLDQLPPVLQPAVLEELLAAYATPDAREARRAFDRIARSLDDEHPDAAAALRDGIDETLALLKLEGTASSKSRPAGRRSRRPAARN